jgi:hypothetical protein
MKPAEMFEAMHDQRWRLANLYKIQDKNGRRVPFVPNDAQMRYLENATQSDIILKARQLGMTTLMCILGLDEVLFNDDWRVGIIAHTLGDANEIFETKVKFPYESLQDGIKAARPAKNDRAGLLRFTNGSSIRVATSARSGTLQRLHVSEFGKICAIAPHKAREIVTGAFPAVGRNRKTIESTAEGQEGYFYQFCDEAQRDEGSFKFHFFAWHQDRNNVYDIEVVRVTKQHEAYFNMLRVDQGIDLTDGQKAWWIWQEGLLGGDMKRENPSFADESFQQAVEGAYFASQFQHADSNEQVGRFPIDHKYKVNTFWDLGRNDMLAIWLHQRVGTRDRFVGYYENSGEHIAHYAQWLADWGRANSVTFDDHYWPHDGDRQDLFLTDGRLAEAEKHGLRPMIVPRVKSKMLAIDAARARFANCDFDQKECDIGIKRLRNYRKEWDDTREVWKDRPRHDDNSHGADAFMTYATGYHAPEVTSGPLRRNLAGIK